MTDALPVSTLAQPVSVEIAASCEPALIEVIVPLDSGTVAEALAEIRGDTPSDRSTLGELSNALDEQAENLTLLAKRSAILYALIFG